MMKTCEMSQIVDIRTVGARPKIIEWQATKEECKAIAERLKIRAVKALSASVSVEVEDLVTVKGCFNADVVQSCVVTMADVDEHIKDSFTEYFSTSQATKSIDLDMEAPDVEPIENGRIDVGELVIEYLALALNPYPRKEGVVSGLAQRDKEEEEKTRPFAGLADLLKKPN